MATTNLYLTALAKSREELEAAIARRYALDIEAVELDKAIVSLRRTVMALSDLCGEPPPMIERNRLGLTEAVRKVMWSARRPMTVADVRDGLTELGFDLLSQKNPTASVLVVLGRMYTGGEIQKVVNGSETTWVGPNITEEKDTPDNVIHYRAGGEK